MGAEGRLALRPQTPVGVKGKTPAPQKKQVAGPGIEVPLVLSGRRGRWPVCPDPGCSLARPPAGSVAVGTDGRVCSAWARRPLLSGVPTAAPKTRRGRGKCQGVERPAMNPANSVAVPTAELCLAPGKRLAVTTTFYLGALKFERHLISTSHKIFFFFGYLFRPFENVKTILGKAQGCVGLPTPPPSYPAGRATALGAPTPTWWEGTGSTPDQEAVPCPRSPGWGATWRGPLGVLQAPPPPRGPGLQTRSVAGRWVRARRPFPRRAAAEARPGPAAVALVPGSASE